MSTHGRQYVLAAGVLAAVLGLMSPAFAQHSGGGHGGGGGGHMGGGGHVGGGGAHAGGGEHFGGGGGPHAAVGGHFAGGAVRGGYGGGVRSYGTGFHAGGGVSSRGGAYGGRGGYPGGYYHHGYSTGAYWGGGYWRGGFWPRAYYGLGYAWFLPVLPLAYATYWYGGVPYYYANDVYYTWNPSYDGYTATDPPPVIEPSSAVPSDAPPDQAGAGAPAPGQDAGSQAQVFMYPKNGQSEEQQSTDKRECQQWAAGQAGQGAANSPDYRRALIACIDGRGYSAN